MLDALYPFLYRLALALAFSLKGFFPKLKKGFQLRRSHEGIPPWLNHPKGTRPFWIHAPSGEFEYAIPVIRELKKKDPSVPILLTYYTGSYLGRVSKEPLLDFYCPLPWDTHAALSEFIEHHKPRQLLIAQTGIWPKMLEECRNHNVPTAIFSMPFNKRPRGMRAFFYRWLMNNIDHFYVVSEADKANLEALNPRWSVTVMGDTRYDQCLYRLEQEHPLKVARDVLTKKVFVCASTWPEDEAVLLPYIRKHVHEAHWILVPHEIDHQHMEQIRHALAGTPTTLYSQMDQWTGDGVLVVDEFGVLATLYKIADAAFIGGSFRARVHSVMESLACGNLTFVGPHHLTNREALEFSQFQHTAIAPVHILPTKESVQELLSQLHKWRPEDREILKKAFVAKTGTSRHLANIFLS